MSLSRSRVRGLRSAGWTVVEEGPLVELRRWLVGLATGRRWGLGRVETVEPMVHLPARRSGSARWSR